MARLRVLIAVTHLLGIGHLARMLHLARSLAAAGHAVRLASGGRRPPVLDLSGIDLLQLPPVHCRDADFSVLLGPDGGAVDAELLERRAAILAAAVTGFRPDVVITELYPFGRRVLAAEFEALIAAAAALAPRPALLASIRDVLNPPAKPGRAESVLVRLARDYDAVLVHGDPAALPLAASWPVTPALERRLRTVGYLQGGHAGMGMAADGPRAGILVSGGGSGAGLALYRHALGAAALLPEQGWHLLVGHGVAEADFAALRTRAPANVRVERARPDFPDLLARAALSVSQAGYNTVLDLASAGVRAILVPFAEGREREQGLRAAALAARGLATMIEPETLDPARLAAAARAALAAPVPDWSAIRRDGATRAVAAVETAAERVQARHAGWNRLDAALEAAGAAGIAIPLWIRDDDAVAATPELERFLALLDGWSLPLAVAAIPGRMEPSLVARLGARPGTDLLVHGLIHANHAPAGAKKAEFGAHRPVRAMAAELASALSRARELGGALVLPVLVPPWNRVATELVARLPGLGFSGISTFAEAKPGDTPAGLVRHNCHWDPIAWRAGGGLGDEASLLDDFAARIEARIMAVRAAGMGSRGWEDAAPIGILTHHLVHDGWIERFLAALLGRLAASPAIRFVAARDLFPAGPSPAQ